MRGVVGVFAALEFQLYTSREEVLALLGWQGKGFHAAVQAPGGVEEFMARLREAGNEEPQPSSATKNNNNNTNNTAAKKNRATLPQMKKI